MPEGTLPREIVPTACRLQLEILPAVDHFSGRTEISIELRGAVDRIWIHGQDLRVDRAELVLADGRRIDGRYEQLHPDGIARITLSETVGPGNGLLEIDFAGEFARDLTGLFRTDYEGESYVFSEFQPIQARRAFPGFDEPGFKIPYEIEIITRHSLTALSNSPLLEETSLGGGLKRVRFAKTRPLPSYLVAFAVGPLDVVEGPPIAPNQWRKEPIPLRGIAARGKGSRLAYALTNTAVMVGALEEYFGQPFPYPKLDLVAVPEYSGAMENAALIFYSEYLLLLDEKSSIRQQQAFGATHAHELAHQWLGNLVTMAWWDDLWLNEALADWMTVRLMALWRPELNYERSRLAAVYRTMEEDSLASARSVREPVHDAAGMFAAFDNLTYIKGAAVLTMAENYIGEEEFRQGLRDHVERFADGSADIFDLIESLQAAAGDGKLLAPLFRSFLFQPGVPLIDVSLDCDGPEVRLTLTQSRYLPLGGDAVAGGFWTVPVCLSWGGSNASAPAGRCVVLAESSRDISLGDACPAWVMPNRRATGYYRWAVNPAERSPLEQASRVLVATERMSLADSLGADVRAGRLGAGDYLASLPTLAAALERSASTAPLAEIEAMLAHVVDPDQLDHARAYFGAIYGRRLELIDGPGGAEPGPEQQRFRIALTRFLAEQARDREVRQTLARQAVALTGFGAEGRISHDVVEPDLVATALTVAAQDLGPAFFDHLFKLLEVETSASLRFDILAAVGSAEDPLSLARARNLLLDERLLGNEVPWLLRKLTGPSRIDGTWAWFRGNRSAVVGRYPGFSRFTLPLQFSRFCRPERMEELRAFFAGYERSIPGIAVTSRQAREKIAICDAYRARHGVELRDFFSALIGGVGGP